jgi:uncharacterized protein YbjT (DUF2867 family)
VVRGRPDLVFDSAVLVRIADARNKTQLATTISGFDAVVNVIGGGTLRRNDVASSTTAVALAAAEETNVKRYIAISAGMVALDWPLFKYFLRPLIFRHILAEHRRVEAMVSASSLQWTILRPSVLTNHSAKGYLASLTMESRFYVTTRADVAALITEELEGNRYVRQAVFVVSRHT